jgi:hypothetical protein
MINLIEQNSKSFLIMYRLAKGVEFTLIKVSWTQLLLRGQWIRSAPTVARHVETCQCLNQLDCLEITVALAASIRSSAGPR